MKYPTWKVKGNPTPNERLMVCDKCQEAHWYGHGWPKIVYCQHLGHQENQIPNRMREATAIEYEEGKAAIKTII